MSRVVTSYPALSVAEVLNLPAMVDGWPDAAAALGISRTTFYELANSDEPPLPIVRIGRSVKVRRQDLIKFLGISENGNGAEAATPAPLAETHSSTI